MSIKEELVALLEASGELSGETLARMLGVSRQAVFKTIKTLKDEGYEIEGTQNRGYKMIKSGDALNAETMRKYLNEYCNTAQIVVLPTVDSTNTYAKKLAADGAPNMTVVLAEEQTAGRGRRGHEFFSPLRTGLYMSVIIRPSSDFIGVSMYTVCAANAVCSAIEWACGKKPKIKWVNDIFLGNKKICGILTEATTDFESGGIDSVVIGIGVNITTKAFPQEIREVAGAVNGGVKRNQLAGAIVNALFNALQKSKRENVNLYRSRSLVTGKTITFVYNNMCYSGTVIDINEDAELLVRTKSGCEMVLNSGEVSIKL